MQVLTLRRRRGKMGAVYRLRTPALLACFGLLAAACSSNGDEPAPTSTGSSGQVAAIVASSDLYVGAPQRVAFGLVLADGNLVSFGSVDVAFSYVGTANAPTDPQPGPEATAAYIPTYGTPAGSGGPAVTSPSEGRGVYQASDVTFDHAGFWQAEVTADVADLGSQVSTTTFEVAAEPGIPAPGDEAIPSENLTLDSKGVPESAIDSRAASEGAVPDPGLHEWTIARAIAEGRPALVVFATPVYCVSKFCGPVTNMVEELSQEYPDRAVYIHLEIWKDFGTTGADGVVNDAPLEWLVMPNGDLTEPWLYLIGADGTIVDRWSSMWSEDEVAAELEALPPMAGA